MTDSFERRSLSEEAERVRLELERSERSIMTAVVIQAGRDSRRDEGGFPPTRVSGGVTPVLCKSQTLIPIWPEARGCDQHVPSWEFARF